MYTNTMSIKKYIRKERLFFLTVALIVQVRPPHADHRRQQQRLPRNNYRSVPPRRKRRGRVGHFVCGLGGPLLLRSGPQWSWAGGEGVEA